MNQTKIDAVRALLPQWEVDSVLIGSASNLRWLSGFTGSFGYALISADHALIATDGRYWVQAAQQAANFELYRYVREPGALAAFLQSIPGKRLGIEAQHTTLATFAQLRAIEELELQPLNQTVEPLRDVKTADEIAIIRRAAAIADDAMRQAPRILRPGISERAVAWELEKRMREQGADQIAFDIIVASGPNGARPHHRPGDRQLQIGDAITIDLGAKLDGYHSDLTRTFHLGNRPNAQFLEIYETVADAHAAAIDGLRAGLSGADVDALARNVIDAAGYGEAFKHSLGHGVGLEIHEGPRLSRLTDAPIPAGAVVTVEPGIYLDDWSGVRIEDLLLVTEDGCERLSHCPQEPLVDA